MLQVQFQLLENNNNNISKKELKNSLCALGLNDVLYIVPEFEVEEYD